MISIRPVEPHEWPQYRDIRLRALRDAPDAFGSTWESEAARVDADWAARLQAAVAGGRDRVLFAVNGGQVCGLLWCKLCAPSPAWPISSRCGSIPPCVAGVRARPCWPRPSPGPGTRACSVCGWV